MLHALHDQAARLEHRPALWSRHGGAYVPTSWFDYAQRVKRFALGLHALGFQEGDPLGILSFNREAWHVADLGAMSLGGIPVGLYTTSSVDQLVYILGHCEARFLLVENAKHLATALEVQKRLPALQHLIVVDAPMPLPEGVLRYADVLASGAKADEAPYWDGVHALHPDALATLIYTSGTTGQPKGVALSHRNLAWTSKQLGDTMGFQDMEDERLVSYLPLSHIAEQIVSLHSPLLMGTQVYFADSLDALGKNLTEVRPTVFFAVPRVWEKFKTKAEEGLAAQPPLKRRLVEWARATALERNTRVLSQERVPSFMEAKFALARRLVFEPLKTRIGLEKAKLFSTSAAPIGRDVLDFFASIDVVLLEVWGMTEVSGPATVSTAECARMGTVGRPMLGVEVRIAQDGEILVQGGNVCLGYHRNPEATQELLADGWLHTGDVGQLDSEGFLRITGRKKEIIVTSGGKKTSPANIEELLKGVSPVGHALVVGDRRNYLVALVTLEPDRVRKLAREKGWPEDVATLMKDPRLQQHLYEAFERDVNPKLSRFETIKRFRVLPGEFSIDGGELTPSMKMRRKVVEQKYADAIEALYNEPGAPGVAHG
ncbi:long-chain fatty acid--CoA ligase [Corallococcus exiguus]|nr:long-chain fatty acid--CoA ligase [Corallococcus exiguus]NNC01691.1 long-chain fatty acid--CoA ligase [Corallococcus exiguus]NPC52910.1 long-chain fatty acid--CoA ligase [Corallococcus exiguus]RKH84538.1 long-chain fatty acid--CoA ligase [Corallococcus sp. AB032C]